jgi:hypothetical protein
MSLDLCSICRRHVRATETTCPFCGATLTPGAVAPPARNLSSSATRSRAQRYVLGAAVAAGIGIAKASASTGADVESETMAVASDPTSEPTSDPAQEDAGAMPVPEPREDPRMYERQGNPCVHTGACGCGPVICPPYGCVFPDEDCAIEHV